MVELEGKPVWVPASRAGGYDSVQAAPKSGAYVSVRVGDNSVWVPAPKVEMHSDSEEVATSKIKNGLNETNKIPTTADSQCNLELICEICSKSYADKRKLAAHVRYVHSALRPFVCKICSHAFKRKHDLKHHLLNIHEGAYQLFPCNVCGYKAKYKWRLKDHYVRCHTDNFETSCDICGMQLKLKRDLNSHVKQMHTGPLVCESCGKTLPNYRSLYCHQVNHHGGGAKVNRSFKCSICCKAFVSRESLEAHNVKDHDNGTYYCNDCGKSFTGKCALTFHIHNVHRGDRPHSCPVCNKAFKTHNVLQLHLFSHTTVKPYRCDICGSAYSQRSSMMLHRRKHPGDLPPVPPIKLEVLLKSIKPKIDELVRNNSCKKVERYDED